LVAATGSGAGAAPKQQPPLRILVTNDDGVSSDGSDGIDALVEALRGVKGVKVTVIAPAEHQSGRGSTTTGGTLTGTPTTTKSGVKAIAVAGTPADSVIYALEQGGLKQKPNLVMSGINPTQNLGAFTDLSGTVAAAKTAAARGIPAVAFSQGVARASTPDYPSGVKAALAWLKQYRKALSANKGKTTAVVLESVNIPTCTSGAIRGTLATTIAPNSDNAIVDQNCASTLASPANDIEAFNNGFITVTKVPVPAG
ncbi:MAG: survival protein SurE, partial [Acidimicrobiia bacterium]|nr:survival protein SurE [Acidimicrobiia bacterium]